VIYGGIDTGSGAYQSGLYIFNLDIGGSSSWNNPTLRTYQIDVLTNMYVVLTVGCLLTAPPALAYATGVYIDSTSMFYVFGGITSGGSYNKVRYSKGRSNYVKNIYSFDMTGGLLGLGSLSCASVTNALPSNMAQATASLFTTSQIILFGGYLGVNATSNQMCIKETCLGDNRNRYF
jgi:hypothetical protein